ncbi:uncharacterized protein N7482_000984 [Penicillium canariense]|uniref:Uncharacterized protein n=1 Tax=Penicillium canariense TaxID=189055 RepID=A0A9W9IEY7_9EURO|nr:uncharacterized protein N7482_000984 [Penicillium canariense]KAJ5175107.1 hypothetical protein N7482_000984 [Penicillium canariense]
MPLSAGALLLSAGRREPPKPLTSTVPYAQDYTSLRLILLPRLQNNPQVSNSESVRTGPACGHCFIRWSPSRASFRSLLPVDVMLHAPRHPPQGYLSSGL